MFWKKKPKTVHVAFINADTGKPFAETSMPVDRLPANFEAATTMHLGQEDWEVVRANPMTAAEFGRTGKLQLLLRRVPKAQQVDPKNILFSLPTICDAIPEVAAGSTKLGKSVLELHEDDWRQTEFVLADLRSEIDAELASIRAIHEHHRVAPGFKQIHVRKRIPNPLPGSALTTDEVIAALGGRDATRYDGVAYARIAGLIDSAFAAQSLSGVLTYGRASPAGVVGVLGLANSRANNLGADRDALGLADLSRRHGLCLVDWCRAALITPDEFDGYFAALNKSAE